MDKAEALQKRLDEEDRKRGRHERALVRKALYNKFDIEHDDADELTRFAKKLDDEEKEKGLQPAEYDYKDVENRDDQDDREWNDNDRPEIVKKVKEAKLKKQIADKEKEQKRKDREAANARGEDTPDPFEKFYNNEPKKGE